MRSTIGGEVKWGRRNKEGEEGRAGRRKGGREGADREGGGREEVEGIEEEEEDDDEGHGRRQTAVATEKKDGIRNDTRKCPRDKR